MGKWRRVRSLPRRWQRNHLITKYGNTCYLCGSELAMKEITFDHWEPLSRGGEDDLPNYRLAHAECNQLKSNLTPEEFLAFQNGEIRYDK